jgi:hypothetical protein
MLKTKCEIEPVGDATNQELTERVPGALLALVLDEHGNLTPLRLRNACVAKKIDESDLHLLNVKQLKQLDSMAILGFEGSSCWVLRCGDWVYVCK